MRGQGVSARAELAETPLPLTPTPLPREKGLRNAPAGNLTRNDNLKPSPTPKRPHRRRMC